MPSPAGLIKKAHLVKELHDIGYRGRAAKGSRKTVPGQNPHDDRQASKLKEEERKIVPLRTILVIIALLGIGYWQLRDYISFGDSVKAPDVEQIDVNFDHCVSGDLNRCVSSGDSFTLNGRKIRLSDITAPRIMGAQCDAEKQLGEQSAERLRALLSAGLFELRPDIRGRDSQGRILAVAMRDGVSLGALVESEGLAQPVSDNPPSWCP